jgi:LysM repeat protein
MTEGIEIGGETLGTGRGLAALPGELDILPKIVCIFAFAILCLVLAPRLVNASPEQTYTVSPGDSIAKIANHFGVGQRDLMEANDIRDARALRPGRQLVIPDELRHGSRGYVIKPGDTLARIAQRFKVSVSELQEFNRLGEGEHLRVGRILLVPDSMAPRGGGRGAGRRTPVTLVRWQTGDSAKVFLTNQSGSVNQRGRAVLSALAGARPSPSASKKKGKGPSRKLLHPRLVQLLGRVAERYPGRSIHVVSGYRPYQKGNVRNSMHTKARALDFRVEGISNRELYDLIRAFPKTGTGYYPNSTFVHLDVRDKSVTWIDYSRPGESAKYRKPNSEGDIEALSDFESAAEDPPDPGVKEVPSFFPNEATGAEGETAPLSGEVPPPEDPKTSE